MYTHTNDKAREAIMQKYKVQWAKSYDPTEFEVPDGAIILDANWVTVTFEDPPLPHWIVKFAIHITEDPAL